jgi:hypothetical protein
MDSSTVRLFIVAGFLMTGAGPLDAGERLEMRVSPSVSFAPANLVVRATIEANTDNRAIEIVAESPDFYRSSEIQLNGDRAPRTSVIEFRSLPSGSYHVRAVLRGSGGEELAAVQQRVNIIESLNGQ